MCEVRSAGSSRTTQTPVALRAEAVLLSQQLGPGCWSLWLAGAKGSLSFLLSKILSQGWGKGALH